MADKKTFWTAFALVIVACVASGLTLSYTHKTPATDSDKPLRTSVIVSNWFLVVLNSIMALMMVRIAMAKRRS